MNAQTKTFGKYEILGELGRGGFATVYRAKDITLGREVALKLLDPSRTWEPGFVERFYQEARIAAQLKHPNIITVHEIGEVDGQLFIAMELVRGGSLRDGLEVSGAMGIEETVALLRPVAGALDFAHGNGVVHRDVKPANILLDPSPDGGVRPVLTDFGLVKALSQSTELTQSGAILGTVEYMAPEQADSNRRSEISAATDTYSLGVVAYHMLTGQVPFTGSTIEVLMAHANKQPPSPLKLRADLSPAISDAILKALAKQPEDRFSTATGFVQALGSGETTDQIAEKPPVLAPPPEPVPTEFDDAENVPTPTVREKDQKVELKSKGRSRWWWLVIPIILFAVVFAIIVLGTDTFHPHILELSYNPKQPAPGDDITILWRTENAQRIEVWPLGLDFAASAGKGLIENGVSEDTDLAVIASSWLGEDEWALPIEVDGAIEEITDQPVSCIDAGEHVGAIGPDDCSRTIEMATQFIDEGCKDSALWVNRATCYEDLGQFDAALADFAFVIELNPSEPWHYIYRAEVYQRMGENELRLADLNKAVSVAPGDPQTYFHRAEYYEEQGEWQAAIDDINQALELAPAEPDYYDGRGEIYRQMGDIEAAAGDFEKFMELSVGLKEQESRREEVEAWLEGKYKPKHTNETDPGSSQADSPQRMTGDKAIFSPDGTQIVTSIGEEFHLWDAKTGKKLKTFRGHQDYVSAVDFSPNGSRIVSASYDGTAALWDVRTGVRLRALEGHSDRLYAIRFSPNGSQIATTSEDRSIRIWDSENGEMILKIANLDDPPLSVDFSPDGSQILSARWAVLEVWDSHTGKLRNSLSGHETGIQAAVYSHSGDRMMSTAKGGTTRIWNALTASSLLEITAPETTCLSNQFSASDEQILLVCHDGTTRLWDIQSNNELMVFEGGHTGTVNTAVFSPNDLRILTAGEDLTVRIWDAMTGKELTVAD